MRIILPVLAALLLILALIWGGTWWYAENQMQASIEKNFNNNSNPQYQASYDSLARGTSPLTASVTLTNLRFTSGGNPTTGPVTITLPTLTYRIDALNPSVFHLDLPAQIAITTSRGDADVTIGSSAVSAIMDLPAALAGKTPFITGTDFTLHDISILANGSLKVMHIDTIGVHETINKSAGAGQMLLQAQENFDGLALSPLLTRLANIPFNGTITHLGINFNISGPLPADYAARVQTYKDNAGTDPTTAFKSAESLGHEWASAGGNANASLTLIIGPSTLNMAGTVKFDSSQQPEGTADVTANHLDAFSSAILNAYPQVQTNINQLEARLSPYLSSTDADGQLLTVHVTYGNTMININGQPAAPLPPLDWNYTPSPPPVPNSGAGQ